ncbi:MAG: PKD domain-containing protein, partial [Chitinophagaceae bacterium]
ITVSAPTGAGLEYSLDGVSYQTSTTFSGLSSGSYTVRVRNATSCVSSTTSATVNAQPPTPVAPTLSVTQPTCTVATGTITVSAPTGAGYTYSKDGSTYQSSTTFSGLVAGNYNITVRNSFGCTSAITLVTINSQPSTPSQPTISASGPTTICNGGSVDLTSTLATSYQWYLNGSPISGATNQTYTASSNGNYTVVVTNASGCSSAPSAITTVTISVLTTPSISGPSIGLCAGGSILLTSTPSTSYQWYLNGSPISGANNQTYTATAAGNYSVTVSNAFGCSATSVNYTIIDGSINPIIQYTGSTNICSGSSILLSLPSALSYQWYLNGNPIPGAIAQTYNANASGIYTATVTNAYGCTETTAGITVTVYFVGSVGIAINGGTNPICVGGFVQLCPSTWGWSNYQWYKNGVAIPAPIGVSACITLNPADIGSYTLQAQNGAGCWTDQSTPINITYNSSCNLNPPRCYPNWSYQNATTNCDSTLLFTATGTNVSGTTYSWDFGDGTTGTGTPILHKYPASGAYLVKLVVSNATCSDSSSYIAYVNNCTSSSSSCQSGWWQQPATNNCDSTIRFNVSSPIPGATYTWNFGDGTTGTGYPVIHKYLSEGMFSVKLIVVSGTCTDSSTYNIYISNCTVTGGFTGGVESKSLGSFISLRLFGNA